MLRLADELGGKILIDGIDHTSMALGELRGRLALIPQEATMFQGDIRLNLDPLGHFSTRGVILLWQFLPIKHCIQDTSLGILNFV